MLLPDGRLMKQVRGSDVHYTSVWLCRLYLSAVFRQCALALDTPREGYLGSERNSYTRYH